MKCKIILNVGSQESNCCECCYNNEFHVTEYQKISLGYFRILNILHIQSQHLFFFFLNQQYNCITTGFLYFSLKAEVPSTLSKVSVPSYFF